MKTHLQQQILQITDWRHPYNLDEGLQNQLAKPWYKAWNEWRIGTDLERINLILRGMEAKTVLDLGCNDGFYGFAFAKLGAAQVIGVDAREKAIRRANLIKEYFDFKNISFICQDLQAHDLAKKLSTSFDLVLFYGVLYHLSNPIETLRALGKITQKVIAVQTFITGSDAPILKLKDENVGLVGSGLTSVVCHPSQSATVKMLQYAGFDTILRICPYPYFTSPLMARPHNATRHFGFFYGIKTTVVDKAKLYSLLNVTETYDPNKQETQVVVINNDTPPLTPSIFL